MWYSCSSVFQTAKGNWRTRISRLRVTLRWLVLAPVAMCSLGLTVIPIAHGIEVNEQIINKDLWPTYPNGSNLASLQPLKIILSEFEEQPKIQIIIRHPGGDSGLAWGQALHRWFVSYGVPSGYLSLEPGSGDADRLVVSLIDRRPD